MDITLDLVIIAVLVLFSAFFSSAEMGIFSASRMRIQHMMESGVKNVGVLNKMRENSHKTLTTILIGNNLANIAASSIATALAMTLFGSWGVAIATGVMTMVILVFGEIIPKSYAVGNHSYAILSSRILRYISFFLFPVVWVVDKITLMIMKISGLKNEDRVFVTEDELRTIVNVGEEEGSIMPEEKEMIHNVLEFRETEVEDIMVHRTQIDAIDIDSSDEDIRRFLVETSHSHIPVYEESIDNIKGIFSSDAFLRKILINCEVKLSLRKEDLMEPYFVPKTMLIDLLFREMKNRKIKMAIVVDEYGGTAGLVNMSDVLEEIVGEIPEASDDEEKTINKIDENTAVFPADSEIEEVGEFFGSDLEPDADYRTIGGCITEKLGKLPNKGESVDLGEFKFVAEEIRRHKIELVRVIRTLKEKDKNKESDEIRGN